MSTNRLTALLAGAAISALSISAALAATPSAAGAYKAPLNAYGQPDLEGTWTNATLTVLERPKEYGTRKAMTPEGSGRSRARTRKCTPPMRRPGIPR